MRRKNSAWLDPPHHYIEQITPAIASAAQWWGRALVRTNALDPAYRGEIDRLFAQMFEREWRTGCDRDMCLWEEDMPPVIVTATPTPGFLLLLCMERIAAELQRSYSAI